MLSELSPFEHRLAEIYGGRVERIDMTVKLEDFLNPSLTGLSNHIESELLEDTLIALLVSLAKIAPRHGFAYAEMVEFSCMGFHGNYEVSQTLTV